MIRKEQKCDFYILAVLLMLIVSACGANTPDDTSKDIAHSDGSEFIVSEGIYEIAWQYIISQLEELESSKGFSIGIADIFTLELANINEAQNEQVQIYSLDYVYYVEGQNSAWRAYDKKENPYLFVKDQRGELELLGVEFLNNPVSRKYEEIIGALHSTEPETVYKESSSSDAFSESEIAVAIEETRTYYSDNYYVINVWFDEDSYQAALCDYLQNSLYGMDEAASRGDLITLNCDLYSISDCQLYRNWRVALIRDNKDFQWKLVDQGY